MSPDKTRADPVAILEPQGWAKCYAQIVIGVAVIEVNFVTGIDAETEGAGEELDAAARVGRKVSR